MTDIICPHCGFTKEVSEEHLPKRSVRVTCPRCKESFYFPPEETLVRNGSGKLTDTGDLFAAAWNIFRQRLGTLIPLSFISLLVIVLPMSLFVAGGYFISVFAGYRDAFAIAGAVTGGVVGMVAFMWAMGALTFAAVDESLGIKTSMSCAWSRLGSFVWLFLLLPFVILGGYFLFVVPGIIFSILFLLSQYVLAEENERGLNAMLKSREYIRGYAWPVFFRMLVLLFATSLVTSLLNLVPVVGPFASYFVTPFVFIFTVLIYRDLRSLKGEIAFDNSAGAKFLWLFLGALGFVVFFILFAAMVTSNLFTQMQIH